MTNDVHERPLTDDELRKLREIVSDAGKLHALIVERDRARWLFVTIRASAAWIVGVLLAITVGFDALKKAILAMVGK
jgi:hypothetical protein